MPIFLRESFALQVLRYYVYYNMSESKTKIAAKLIENKQEKKELQSCI